MKQSKDRPIGERYASVVETIQITIDTRGASLLRVFVWLDAKLIASEAPRSQSELNPFMPNLYAYLVPFTPVPFFLPQYTIRHE